MSYCNQGDKPTVEYQFASSPKRNYQSEVAPIDVEVLEIPNNSDGSGDILYAVTFQYWAGVRYYDMICGQPPNIINSPFIWGKIGEIVGCDPPCNNIGSSSTALYINLYCRGQGQLPSEYKVYSIQVPGVPGYNFQQIENPKILNIKKVLSVPDPGEKNCKIIISHAGKTLFTDVGKCPGTFNVLCREPCPDGTCCECDCGDVICCYGENGTPLKIIRK